MHKTAVYTPVKRRHYTSETANIKKVILISSTLLLRQCHAAYYEIIAIFKLSESSRVFAKIAQNVTNIC